MVIIRQAGLRLEHFKLSASGDTADEPHTFLSKLVRELSQTYVEVPSAGRISERLMTGRSRIGETPGTARVPTRRATEAGFQNNLYRSVDGKCSPGCTSTLLIAFHSLEMFLISCSASSNRSFSTLDSDIQSRFYLSHANLQHDSRFILHYRRCSDCL